MVEYWIGEHSAGVCDFSRDLYESRHVSNMVICEAVFVKTVCMYKKTPTEKGQSKTD